MEAERERELLWKAAKPGRLAAAYHRFYAGKIQVAPRCTVRSLDDFSIWYTPGVAEVSRLLAKEPALSYEYTSRWNLVGVVSDGSRVLGLGKLGPSGALPVMEGKALLFKYLGGVDAFPLCVSTTDPDELLSLLKWLEPSFGGINLEDIETPKAFYLLEEARKKLEIPVWHDDQQGTATVVLAGILNALKVVGKKLEEVKITLVGAGAANIRAAHVLILAGADPGKLILVDSKGTLHRDRPDMEALAQEHPWKHELALRTNAERVRGGIPEAMEGADVVVGASTPGPGVIKKEWVKRMAPDGVVFATANPVPEIWPWEAKEAGARVVGTGRSDFPNQINNSLGFPGIFRGVLDVRAWTITDDMCVAAARALADFACDRGIHEDDVVPRMDEWEVYPRVAVAAALKSIEQGVARLHLTRAELETLATTRIREAREVLEALKEKGLVREPPPEEEILGHE